MTVPFGCAWVFDKQFTMVHLRTIGSKILEKKEKKHIGKFWHWPKIWPYFGHFLWAGWMDWADSLCLEWGPIKYLFTFFLPNVLLYYTISEPKKYCSKADSITLTLNLRYIVTACNIFSYPWQNNCLLHCLALVNSQMALLNWNCFERSACEQRSNLCRPLFLVN